MRFQIVHQTRYAYSQPVVRCHNEARMQPRNTARQLCARSEVVVAPLPAERAERGDFFGNRVLYFSVQDAHEQLVVTASSEVDTQPAAPVDLVGSLPWETARTRLRHDDHAETRDARQFTLESLCAAGTPELAAYAEPSLLPGRPLLDAVRDLSTRIHREFTFDAESSSIATPLTDVLARRSGVCQDFAHLAIGCLRAAGLAARYVSGYLETVPPPGQPRLQGADRSHAWFAVFVPDRGWVDFDPTNDQMPDECHITTAWGRDYADVTPLKGVIFGGSTHRMDVAVDVVRVE